MSNAINTSLFDVMPPDAYLTIAKATLESDPKVAALNMLSYYDRMESFFDSRVDAESLVLPYFVSEYGSIYPRLKRVLQGRNMSPAERSAKREIIADVIASQGESHDSVFIERLNADNERAYHYATNSSDVNVQLAAKRSTAFDSASPFYAVDTPGFAKAKVLHAREQAMAILRLGVPLLVRWARKYDMRFEMRSPLAFSGPQLTELLRYAYPIENMERFTTLSMIRAWDVAYSIDPALGCPPSRAAFRDWYEMSGTAGMIGHSHHYLLTPALMPSILLGSHHATLPVVVGTWTTPFVNDVVQHVTKVPGAYVTSLSVNHELEFEYPASSATAFEMSQCMALVSFAFSIVIANLELGRGHHKPSWVHSNLNPHHVQNMLRLAPVILSDMSRVLRDEQD